MFVVTPGSAVRRLVAAMLTLAAIDALVPGSLERAERARYEGASVYHFPYSDLFATGPAVAYLRDHPRGDRPRAVFVGSSVVWGYRLAAADSLPEQFQRREPSLRVLNFAVNGFATGSAYLMIKDVIDSVDTVYFHVDSGQVNPGLARLIPVSDSDVQRFHLDPPDRTEQALERALGVWRLYRDSYRLQAAVLGTSTRNYLYSHKSALVGGAVDEGRSDLAPSPPSPRGVAILYRPAAAEPPLEQQRALAAAAPELWEYASMIRAHGKRAVFWKLAPSATTAPDSWNELNRVFRGSAAFVQIAPPPEMMIDDRHLSARGAAEVAAVLQQLTPAPPDAVH